MEYPAFEQMVGQLEVAIDQKPVSYRIKVLLLVLVGFGIIALMMAAAGVTLLALVAVPIALWSGGFHAWAAYLWLAKFLLILAIPVWLLIRSTTSALLTRLPVPEGVEVRRSDVPALFDAIDAIRSRMRGPRFHHVLVTDDLNAAVVQRPLFGLFGPSRNYLILGLPLLESLPPAEASAVVAHEYGHLSGAHGRFAAFVYRLRITWATVHGVSRQWQGFGGKALGRLVESYAPYFNAYTFVLARANEYQADAAAAELVGSQATASALKRVDVTSAHYGKFIRQTFRKTLESPTPPDNIAVQWASAATQVCAEEARRWLKRAVAHKAGVADTHPSLRDRLKALQCTAPADLEEVPVWTGGPSAAQAWLGPQLSPVRDRVQARWRDDVRDAWRQRHETVLKQRARLAELCGMTSPTQEQHSERLRLRLDLEALSDFEADLASFAAAYPASVLGPYLEGEWRLSMGDEMGLACLERAMELDADAVKPACEKAFEYLREREDARADAYQERWLQRDRWEQSVHPELRELNVDHELSDPELTDEQRSKVEALVQANHAGVAHAYIARRILPSDATVLTYVLGLELEPAPPRLEMPHEIVSRLADTGGWPVHLIVCTLDGKNAKLKPRLQALPSARIELHP
ncbi:M48 family metalloprotease [Ideonella sp. BN130291]|uniref:M48 family metalloprotease n=1 Tax=Ideonella sp. BN130291 TaxID=3112940 RepID=UPI002E2642DC|nr:M48 family metalloprotease [Ideonella sp. BN130291]